ncbi:MAG: hypothetical protein JXB15_15600 [Anaerolineales bacterium]|nr:hypothetical protein [Anaerolineales bacterium]
MTAPPGLSRKRMVGKWPGWLPLVALGMLLAASVFCVRSSTGPVEQVELTAESLVIAPTISAESPIASALPAQLSQTPAPAAVSTPSPLIPENRLLVLEWPARIKAGDADVVRLTLEMDEFGTVTPTAQVGGNLLEAQSVQIPNLYDTHTVVAEARLDLAGLEVAPGGDIAEALLPGQPVSFAWSIRPTDPGAYQGTVWLHLRFLPRSGGDETRRVLSAQRIEIQAVNFLGLGGSAARVLGSVGTVVGSVFGLDNLVGWGWQLIRRRRGVHAKQA